MTRFQSLAALFGTLLVAAVALPGDGRADPCGMVPPIQVTGGTAPELERIGAQRTLVTRWQIDQDSGERSEATHYNCGPVSWVISMRRD